MIKLLGWIHVLLAGAGLAGGSILCLALMRDPQGGPALYYIGPLFVMISVAFLLPGLIGGLGLLADRAWARVVMGLFSGLLVLAFPIGTVLGVFGLWALFWSNAPPPAPRPPREAIAPGGGANAPGQNRLALLLSMSAVGAGFLVVLGAGFRLNDQPPPREIADTFLPAIVVFAGAVAALVLLRPFAALPAAPRTLNPIAQHHLRQRLRRKHKAFEAAEAARMARLAADPLRRKYVARIEAEGYWSDEQIEYDLDPDRLVTCVHLQPIERAMREDGLAVRFLMDSWVNAQCRVDEPALMAQFRPDPCVSYAEYYEGGRAAEDFPTARINCKDCRSAISALHPLEATPQTPWFPAGRA